MKRIFAHIGFSSATALFLLNRLDISALPYICTALAVLLAASMCVKETREAVTVPLCIGSALFSCLVYATVFYSAVAPAVSLAGQEGVLSFYITDLPEFSDGKYVYTARSREILINGAPQSVKLIVKSAAQLNAEAYTVINAKASFYSFGSTSAEAFGKWGNGIYTGAVISDAVITDTRVFSPLYFVLLLRNDIIETLVNSIRLDMGAFSAGLVTGDKYYLPYALKNSFVLAGASHILAVSGLHLSVITGAICFILKKLGAGQRITAAAVISASLFYMALAGFSHSVVRAGIMVICVFGALIFKRRADTLNSLGIAVFIICLNPFAVTDAGAVLSVLSVLSLVLLYPYLCSKLGFVSEKLSTVKRAALKPFASALKALIHSVMISVSVIVFTLPACVLFFDRLNFTGLISNVFVIPLGSAATVLSFVCYISCKLGILSGLFCTLCCYLNMLICKTVSFAASLRLLSAPVSTELFYAVAAALVLCAVGMIAYKKKSLGITLGVSVCFIAVFLAINSLWQYNSANVLITRSGASAAAYKGATVVSRVRTKSDYNEIRDFIDLHGDKIDLLLCGENNELEKALYDEFGALRVVTCDNSSPFGDSVITDNYKAELSESFTVSFVKGGDFSYVLYEIDSKTLVSGDNIKSRADVCACGGEITDEYGKIRLSDGSVLYCFNKNYLTAGRF
ncbi:MAG: ComEC/Rec2 family competence protein [Eubacterium sp.]|nr:ComEC/Rec2 family competence protein [Eubacterium sp.]